MITKKKIYSWVIVGIISFIVIIVSLITWFYPFSILSVNKSITYESEEVLFNGKRYNEILSDFKTSFDEDLDADSANEYPNLTIIQTQFILPIFEQDWLIRNESMSIDKEKLDVMLKDVARVRKIVLNLIAQADYSKEDRGYLVEIVITNLLSMENTITALKNNPHLTRIELNFRLDILHDSYISLLRSYISFYDMVIPE